MSIAKTTISTLAVCALAGSAYARDNVQVAGSSTVLPYASIVAEAFGENFDFPTPVVEWEKAQVFQSCCPIKFNCHNLVTRIVYDVFRSILISPHQDRAQFT